MAVKLGVLALLEAEPDKGEELAAFLRAGRDLAAAEAGTITWYAFKAGDTTYGIFDTSRPRKRDRPTSAARFPPHSVRSPAISWRRTPTFVRSR